MFRRIKRNWRKSRNFSSAIIASMLVSFFFGKYLSILLGQENKPGTPFSIQGFILFTFVLMVLLYIAYKIYSRRCVDLPDRQTFFDNYFISLVAVVLSTLMLVYNSYLPDFYFWVLSFVVILVFYFPLNWLYIQLRPK